MMQDWGYLRLGAHTRAESIDEMHHAEEIIERILYFDGVPNVQRLLPIRIGEDVPEQFRSDLELEYGAVERLNRAVAKSVEVGDNGSRDLFERILVSEEEHIDWLETQLETIDQIGVENYLTQQLHGG